MYGWHWGFGAAGIGMLAGLAIYVYGTRYLPAETRVRDVPAARAPANAAGSTLLVLLGVCIAVTVFRAAYEQVGNTVALWADVGIARDVGGWSIPMTWFQALLAAGMLIVLDARMRRIETARANETGAGPTLIEPLAG